MSRRRVLTMQYGMRILANILLFLGVLFLPWWLVLLVAVWCFFLFPRFHELFWYAFLADLLYAAPQDRFFGFEFALSLITVVLIVVLTLVKKQMRV